MWSTYLRFPNGEVVCIKDYPLDARELARAEARTMATTLGVTLVDAIERPPAKAKGPRKGASCCAVGQRFVRSLQDGRVPIAQPQQPMPKPGP
jgi:hypothetical protein